MSGLCEGRVAIVTGAARGIGREHALLLAKEGAKVVVNDLGGSVDGSGADISPAQSVVNEIEAMGSEAVVNGDDVSSFDGAKNMVDQAINHFGKLDILVNNAGILRQHDRGRVGLGGPSAPEGHVRAVAPRRRLLAGDVETKRRTGARANH